MKGPAEKQTSSATWWLRMRVWRMSLRRTKRTIISCTGPIVCSFMNVSPLCGRSAVDNPSLMGFSGFLSLSLRTARTPTLRLYEYRLNFVSVLKHLKHLKIKTHKSIKFYVHDKKIESDSFVFCKRRFNVDFAVIRGERHFEQLLWSMWKVLPMLAKISIYSWNTICFYMSSSREHLSSGFSIR